MSNSNNGRRIKIRVQETSAELPPDHTRPMLSGPDGGPKALLAASPQDAARGERAETGQARRQRLEIQEERRRLLLRLIRVADNLEYALNHVRENDPVGAGIQLTLKDLHDQLAQEGVEPVAALGQPFDPQLHEAVATDGSGGSTVIAVLRTGYTLDGTLLRPARVLVGQPNS